MTKPMTGELQQVDFSRLIQWGDHLSVEHPTIDIQHKAIFDLGSSLYEKWRNGGNLDVFLPAVDKLANLLEAHFAYEEHMLADIGYADLTEHSEEHRNMLDRMQMIREHFDTYTHKMPLRGGSVVMPGWQVMQLVLSFTVGHVATSDMGYVQAWQHSREDARQSV